MEGWLARTGPTALTMPCEPERVLFRPADLEGMSAGGRITLQFRRWGQGPGAAGDEAADADRRARRAQAWRWSSVRTIEDARAAGYDDAEHVLGVVSSARAPCTGSRCASPGQDPAIALRERRPPTTRCSRGWSGWATWAYEVLAASTPVLRAPDLAATFGRETAAFQRDVRKLKELGLTESLEIGYRCFPRGQAGRREERLTGLSPGLKAPTDLCPNRHNQPEARSQMDG